MQTLASLSSPSASPNAPAPDAIAFILCHLFMSSLIFSQHSDETRCDLMEHSGGVTL